MHLIKPIRVLNRLNLKSFSNAECDTASPQMRHFSFRRSNASRSVVRPTSPNPCPFADQAAYDSKDNTAFCDCVEDERGLIFNQQTRKCYQQNVKGPCANDEWLVLSNGDGFY